MRERVCAAYSLSLEPGGVQTLVGSVLNGEQQEAGGKRDR